MKIIITAPADRASAYLEHVAQQIEDGFTSGHEDSSTYWTTEDDK